MADISRFLQSVKLPVMPEVARALIRTLNDEDADVITVRDVIAKDPALTAILLRMANSAIFGLSRTVSNLDNAVSVVGMSQIRARALSICMANAFVLPADMNRLDFWRYCMLCAGYARWLAHHIGADEQQAWLTGMMLHLGQIAIAQNSPLHIKPIEQLPRAPGERWERQRQAVGFDEGRITAEMALRWDFPDDVVQCLQHSCNPLGDHDSFSKMAGIVHLAAMLADLADASPGVLDRLPPEVVVATGLDLEQLRARMPPLESLSDTSMLQV